MLNPKKNILFLWSSPFRNGGGVGSVTTILGQELHKRGFQVSYLSLSKGTSYIENNITQYFSSENKALSHEKRIWMFLQSFIKEHNIEIVINQAGFNFNAVLKNIRQYYGDQIKIYSVHHNCIRCLQDTISSTSSQIVMVSNHFGSPLVNHKIWLIGLLKYFKQNRNMGKFFEAVHCAYSDFLVLLSPTSYS